MHYVRYLQRLPRMDSRSPRGRNLAMATAPVMAKSVRRPIRHAGHNEGVGRVPRRSAGSRDRRLASALPRSAAWTPQHPWSGC